MTGGAVETDSKPSSSPLQERRKRLLDVEQAGATKKKKVHEEESGADNVQEEIAEHQIGMK